MAHSLQTQTSAVNETNRQNPILGRIVQLLRYLNASLLRWLQPANPTPGRTQFIQTQFIHVLTPTNPIKDGTVVAYTCDDHEESITSDDGVKLVIPRGAIKSGDSVTFEVATGFCGPFIFLPDCQPYVQLVSPFYWIGVSESYRFQKPVQVELEHYAVVTDPSNYDLMACEDGDQTHTMRPVDHYVKFKNQGDVSLFTFETSHFCSYCLIHKHKQQSQNLKRIGACYLKPANFQVLNHFTVEIWFSFTISYCKRRNEALSREKGMELDYSHTFKASCSVDKSSASHFYLSYQHGIDGWCVDHCRSTKMPTNKVLFHYYKGMQDILVHEESSLFPPGFIVQVIKKSNCITDLNTNITVTLNTNAKEQSPRDSVSFKIFVPVFPIYEPHHFAKKLHHFGLPHELPTAHHPVPKPFVQSASTDCSSIHVGSSPLVTIDDTYVHVDKHSPLLHVPTLQSELTELGCTDCSSIHGDDRLLVTSDDTYVHVDMHSKLSYVPSLPTLQSESIELGCTECSSIHGDDSLLVTSDDTYVHVDMHSKLSYVSSLQSESTELDCSDIHVDDSPVTTSDDSHLHSPLSHVHSPPSHMRSSEKSGVTNYSEQVQEATNLPTNLKYPLSNSTSSSCDYNGGILCSMNGDLKLSIPKGAIKREDLVTFSIAADLYGPFVLPSKRQADLVSPYYWIGVSESYHFQKPIQVEFEHFGACDPSHYQLLTCEDDDESYIMRPAYHELSFKVQDGISLCSYRDYQFCSICLFHNTVDPAINRVAAIYLKTKNFQYLNHFTAEIWFSFPISHCLKRNKELYEKEGMVLDHKCSYTFEVSCDKNSTSCFTLTYHQGINDWHMKHSRSKKIYTKEVNFYNYYTDMEQLKANENNSLFPQRFVVNVMKKSECNTDLDTNIMVSLHKGEGAKWDTVPFKLYVPILSATVTPKQKKLIHLIGNHKCDKCTSPELKDLLKYSLSISTCWREIALNLNISQDRISTIEASYSTDAQKQRLEMFNTWLQSNSSACWCDFVQALNTVGRDDIAEKVTTTHLKQHPESSTEAASLTGKTMLIDL